MKETSYKPGEEIYYHSNMETYKVKVLENNSTPTMIKYKFEVLEISEKSIQGIISGEGPKLKKGQVFNVETKVSSYHQNSEGLLHFLEK